MCIEELFVGAWVLYGGGPVRVVSVGGERIGLSGGADAVLSDVRPLPITSAVLCGFGFRQAKGDNVWLRNVGDMRLTVGLRVHHGVEECRRCAIGGRIVCWNEEIRYVHELQRWWIDRVYKPFGVFLELAYGTAE